MSEREAAVVLVIDDDRDARSAMRTLLEENHFGVVEADDGKDAIHYLTSDKPEPALIVTDLAMPDMTGWEFVNILQAYVRLSIIPVLVVSAHQLHDQPVRDDGVLEFFSKPVEPERFLSAVRRHAITAMQRATHRRAATRKLASSPF